MSYRVSLFIFALALVSFSAQAQVQKIMTLAGNGTAGFGGDGANASGAMLWGPTDVTLDTDLNVYILDNNNFRIRKVGTNDIITTYAGTGLAGNSGDASVSTSANIVPNSIAFDKHGNLFISDYTDNVIRKINRFGIITHYAGQGLAGVGYSGDGGAATAAKFRGPQGIAVDDTGNLFIADAGNHVIRRIDTFGIITTIAGTGVPGYAGNSSPVAATSTALDSPYAVAVDHRGNIYINDYKNTVIRKVDAGGMMTTYAGSPAFNGLTGYAGDGTLDTNARFNDARGMAVDTAGNLYIADALNSVIRKITYATGIITTCVGNGYQGYMGDLGYANGCNLFNPYGVAVDKYGSIYVADANNERLRKTYYTTGVNKVPVVAHIAVYPNPCSGEVSVSGLNISDKVRAYDITGRLVSTVGEATNNGTQTFDIHSLAPGIYLLQVCDNEGVRKVTVKMVKE